MSSSAHRRLVLDLDCTDEPIRGSLSGETLTARPFSGWLELAHAIKQELVAGAAPATVEELQSALEGDGA